MRESACAIEVHEQEIDLAVAELRRAPGVAAPEKTAETKTAAPRVKTSPVIATQAKVNCTDPAFGPFTVCAAFGGVQGLRT